MQQKIDGQCSPDRSQCGDRPYIRFAFSSHNTPSQSCLACKFSAPVSAPAMEQDVKQSGANIFQGFKNLLLGSQRMLTQTFPMIEALSQSPHDGTIFTKNFKSSVAKPKINRDIPDRSQSVFRPNEPQHNVRRDEFNAYLSKPIIQTFSGNPLDFWAFFNRLQSHLPNWLSAERKISYLLQHCEPSVCQNIEHFADLHEGEDCYDLAWIELKRRYGNLI